MDASNVMNLARTSGFAFGKYNQSHGGRDATIHEVGRDLVGKVIRREKPQEFVEKMVKGAVKQDCYFELGFETAKPYGLVLATNRDFYDEEQLMFVMQKVEGQNARTVLHLNGFPLKFDAKVPEEYAQVIEGRKEIEKNARDVGFIPSGTEYHNYLLMSTGKLATLDFDEWSWDVETVINNLQRVDPSRQSLTPARLHREILEKLVDYKLPSKEYH